MVTNLSSNRELILALAVIIAGSVKVWLHHQTIHDAFQLLHQLLLMIGS